MNITFAQTFLEVVKAGNLNRAAEVLNVTESTVTTRINSLEAQLGQKLLIRDRKGTELTSAGFKFLRYAEVMTQAWGQARQELSLSSNFQSVCNVGCHFDLWDEVAKTWADQMRTAHPEVALSFWAGSTEDIGRWLSTGLVDAAFMFEVPVSDVWQVAPLFQDYLVQVSTMPRDVSAWDSNYIYVDLGQEFRRAHSEAFEIANTAVVTISSSRWALDYLLTWEGSGYLPKRIVDEHLRSGALHLVQGAPEFARAAFMISRKAVDVTWPWFDSSLVRLRDTLQST